MAVSKWPEVESKLVLVEAWCRDGLLEKDICHNLGISEQTLNVYKHAHPELREALKRGKEVVDIAVENALFKRTQGYAYEEITRELVTIKDKFGYPILDENGAVKQELKITKVVTKEVQSDVTAQIFWLKNRKPKDWRDKHEVEKTIEIKVPMLEEIQDTFKQMRQLNKVETIDIKSVE